MGLEIASPSVQKIVPRPFVSPKATLPSIGGNRDLMLLRRFPLSSTPNSLELLKSQCSAKSIPRGYTLRRASSADFDGSLEPLKLGIEPDPPVWPERERVLQEVMRANIERRANSVDFPLSLRMIKKKQQRSKESINPLGSELDSACTYSVHKAFSSMVSIVLELQSHALHLRETVSCEDLEAIIDRVQREMHGSFVWLFQQVFSRTPSVMTDVMILLSDFCVYSVLNGNSTESNSLKGTMGDGVVTISVAEGRNQEHPQFDFSGVSLFSGKESPTIAELKTILPTSYPSHLSDNVPGFSPNGDNKISEEELNLWISMVDEASSMQAESMDHAANHEAMKDFVSPLRVDLEPDNYYEYFRTDLAYQMNLFEDPDNPLLLCNYAQFLQLVAHDYDRAEECYKRAIQLEPLDAVALNLYASFLWLVRKDLSSAEERYLEAVSAEPENPYHVSTYANFLWSTGGEETCFPL